MPVGWVIVRPTGKSGSEGKARPNNGDSSQLFTSELSNYLIYIYNV